MNNLQSNVFRSVKRGNRTLEEHAGFYLKFLGKDKKIIDYLGDYDLQYAIPLLPGEYIISHGMLEPALRYIGGEGLVDKVGDFGWLLLLMLEYNKDNFNTDESDIERYHFLFQKNFEELNIMLQYPNIHTRYYLWDIYYILTGSPVSAEYVETVETKLKDIHPEAQKFLYSYLIYSFDKIDVFSQPYLITVSENNFDKILEVAELYKQYEKPENELKIVYGMTSNSNPSTVLLARWYRDSYADVNISMELDPVESYSMEELYMAPDTELLKYSQIIAMYLDRRDLVNIVAQGTTHMNRLFPTVIEKKLLIATPSDKHKVGKIQYNDGIAEYRVIGMLGDLNDTIQENILPIIDYEEKYNTKYDSIMNLTYYYNIEDMKLHLAFLMIYHAIYTGKYSGTYGSPLSRFSSYLASKLARDYHRMCIVNPYYKVQMCIVENGILMQSSETIGDVLNGESIDLEDLVYTIRGYKVDYDLILETAIETWEANYLEGNGILRTVKDLQVQEAIHPDDIYNYIQYCKRISDTIFNYNNVLEEGTKMVMFEELEPEEEEEKDGEGENVEEF